MRGGQNKALNIRAAGFLFKCKVVCSQILEKEGLGIPDSHIICSMEKGRLKQLAYLPACVG